MIGQSSWHLTIKWLLYLPELPRSIYKGSISLEPPKVNKCIKWFRIRWISVEKHFTSLLSNHSQSNLCLNACEATWQSAAGIKALTRIATKQNSVMWTQYGAWFASKPIFMWDWKCATLPGVASLASINSCFEKIPMGLLGGQGGVTKLCAGFSLSPFYSGD